MNRLERLAKGRNLAPPAPGQLMHLNGKDSSVSHDAKAVTGERRG